MYTILLINTLLTTQEVVWCIYTSLFHRI